MDKEARTPCKQGAIFKYRRKDYRVYVTTFLLLLPIYALLKTLFDVHIVFTTGRIVGTEDWISLAFSEREKIAAMIQPDQKRALIVSGSNGLFGISAKLISQQTGIQAVNLSSHAGLGGNYILQRAERILRKGDIVLLPLEYQFYTQSNISNDFERRDTLRRFLISYDRTTLQEVSTMALLEFGLKNIFEWRNSKEYTYYLQGHLTKADILKRLQQQRNDPNFNCFSGLTFNAYGDETCNEGKENLSVLPAVLEPAMSPSSKKIDPDRYIDRFIKTSLQKGAILVPLYPVSTYTENYKDHAFQQYAQKIKNFWEGKGVAFEDSLENSLLQPNLMYNTNYHPKDSGRKVRTQSIIELIKGKI